LPAIEVVGGVPPDLPEHDDLGQRGSGGEEIARGGVLEGQLVERLVLENHQGVLAHGLARPHVHAVEVGHELANLRPRRRFPKKSLTRSRATTSQTSTFLPRLAPASASAAESVLLPSRLSRDDEQAAVQERVHGARDSTSLTCRGKA